jgi:hypothetical protein
MANMSHCRFENTYQDLCDCLEALQSAGSVEALLSEVNQYERRHVKKLIRVCGEVFEEFKDYINDSQSNALTDEI